MKYNKRAVTYERCDGFPLPVQDSGLSTPAGLKWGRGFKPSYPYRRIGSGIIRVPDSLFLLFFCLLSK